MDPLKMNEHNYSISLVRANVIGLLLLFPISALYLFPYSMVWGWEKTKVDFSLIFDNYLAFFLMIILGVVAHELLHGLTWMMAGNKAWSKIKFGFNWAGMAPYAHCREPLEINAYRWGAAMPGIVLGMVPFFIGLISGNGWFTTFGFFFTITASGDILILWLIRDITPGTYVQDHPELAGCQVVESA